ncbi:hypothetical protein [Flavobacterium wongokense]|uniref:hypothetical protein n=1 Tax=Flavobacterium wongokense TaxID=2910674 RepID=UPI001F488A34|nr:hypothetical protein [Flavobacterium sp. WG47]MCF6132813.1 hypothetical protein [Flavobacterium sp. WG47]
MKTNFISNLKRYAFITLAVLGAFVGYSQSTQNPSIGGSKTPSTDPFGQILDIGGSQGAPRDTAGGMIVLSQKTQCIFAYPNDIGGGGKGTNTGGDTGQLNDDVDPYDIGGRGTNTGTGTGEFALLTDTGGGRGTSSDTGQRTDPTYTNPMDTGGNGGVVIGRPELSLEYIPGVGCLVDTGGRDSGGGLLNNQSADIGGGKSSDTGLGQITVADTGGRNGRGTSTTGDYGDDNDDDDDTGGRGSSGTTGEVPESYACLSALN